MEAERAKLNSESPGLEAMCNGARELLADRTEQMVLEIKTFESTNQVKVDQHIPKN